MQKTCPPFRLFYTPLLLVSTSSLPRRREQHTYTQQSPHPVKGQGQSLPSLFGWGADRTTYIEPKNQPSAQNAVQRLHTPSPACLPRSSVLASIPKKNKKNKTTRQAYGHGVLMQHHKQRMYTPTGRSPSRKQSPRLSICAPGRSIDYMGRFRFSSLKTGRQARPSTHDQCS